MEFIHFFIDFILNIDIHLTELVAQYGLWVYGILFFILFCETGLVITPFLRGDSLLFISGSLASLSSNELNVHLMVCLMIIAAVIGDTLNYYIGYLFGERLFRDPNSKIFKRAYLDLADQFYKKHGGKAVILARFIPIVRTFIPFIAGIGKMSYPNFTFYNILGAFLCVLSFTYAGYFFGSLPMVQNHLKLLIVLIIVLSILPSLFGIWRHWRTSTLKNEGKR